MIVQHWGSRQLAKNSAYSGLISFALIRVRLSSGGLLTTTWACCSNSAWFRHCCSLPRVERLQNGMKRIYLLGHPLGHSISPAMQNAALRARGFRDWRYEKLALPPERMRAMLDALRDPDCVGANVTIPHKQSIIPHLDELSDAARQIGAVNTIVKRDGRLVGENTDGAGFLQSLREHHIHPRHARVLIFGAGGAACAVAFALAAEGARQIVLINRTTARAAELADRLHEHFPRLELAVNWWEPLSTAHLVVNASAIGMTPL